ncbi:MAG: exonuclease subunit SbcD, partial [Clostridium sp.]|nr:exonuclease subunit SbcD [Clostridium sp.]
MKFVHTSDWHIGQRFYRYDRDEEHLHFFAQLARILAEERPDALLVSGDIYDTAAPSAQSQRLLAHALMDLRAACP